MEDPLSVDQVQSSLPHLLPQDSCLTNAGRGSNLTLAGTVECDASVMESGGGFGAIGAASGPVVT